MSLREYEQDYNVKHNDQLKMIGVLLGAVVVGLLVYAAYQGVTAMQERQARLETAKKEAMQILDTRGSESFAGPQRNDPWGTPYRTAQAESDEKVVTNYSVVSAGPDKEFGTADDIQKHNGDLNWTNAGTAVGQRAGRSARGFFKGLWNSGDGK